MGIEVVLLANEQLSQPKRFDATMDRIASLLDMKRRPRTEAMERRRAQLVNELSFPWEYLGLYSAAGTFRPPT